MLKKVLRPIYYFLWNLYLIFMNSLFAKKNKDVKDIPIFINNRNRLTTLKMLIDSLEKRGLSNIHIIDNDSSYPPLLEYYKTTKQKIHYLQENVGYLSIWKRKEFKKYLNGFYVYTDSDVVIDEKCPNDFLEVFYNEMKSNLFLMKIGFSLRIDDLPDCYNLKKEVLEWEKQHYEKLTKDGNYFITSIDTTFALYRPFAMGGASRLLMYRSKAPYTALHMPWYNDSDNLSEEEKYYLKNSKTSTHWTKMN
jgi:hypothetical protein